MKRSFVAISIFTAVVLAAVPALAQAGKGGKPKPPQTHPATPQQGKTTHAPAPKTTPSSATHGNAAKGSKAPVAPVVKTTTKSTKSDAAKKTTAPATVTAAAKTKSETGSKHEKQPKSTTDAKSVVAKQSGDSKKPKTSTTTSGAVSPSATTAAPLTPVQQKLQRNTNLASKVQSRLPAGTDLMTASQGFKNLGQFVAAVNVSHNLGLQFSDLKTRMVDRGMSLGQAIHDLRPAASATIEAQRGEYDARGMISESEQAPPANTEGTAVIKPAKTEKTTKTAKTSPTSTSLTTAGTAVKKVKKTTNAGGTFE